MPNTSSQNTFTYLTIVLSLLLLASIVFTLATFSGSGEKMVPAIKNTSQNPKNIPSEKDSLAELETEPEPSDSEEEEEEVLPESKMPKPFGLNSDTYLEIRNRDGKLLDPNSHISGDSSWIYAKDSQYQKVTVRKIGIGYIYSEDEEVKSGHLNVKGNIIDWADVRKHSLSGPTSLQVTEILADSKIIDGSENRHYFIFFYL